MTFPDVSGLPTNLDATYSDNNAAAKDHQQHHDLVHAAVKAMPGVAVRYVDPAGSDSNSGLLPGAAKQSIAAAITSLPGGVGEVRLKPHATFPITSGLSFDVNKVRLVGQRSVLNAASMTIGTALTLTSTVGDTSGSYNNRASLPVLQGIELSGSGRTSTVVGLVLDAPGTTEVNHLRVATDVAIHGFGVGISLQDGTHNVEFNVNVYECGRCVDDTLALGNAGERIVFNGGAFFNSSMVGYLRNGQADYIFDGCSFDYNEAQLDINGPTVTLIAPHVESNDANSGTRYPFTVGGGGLTVVGGVLTGSLTTIPAYVNATDASGRTAFRDVRIYGLGAGVPFSAGVGTVVRHDAQTQGDVGTVYSTVDRSLASGAQVLVPLGSSLHEVGDFFNAATPDRITAPQAGFYQATLKVQIPAVGGGSFRQFWLSRNGNDADVKHAIITLPVGSLQQASATDLVYLDRGQWLELHAFQDSGAPLTVTAANLGPSISLVRVA